MLKNFKLSKTSWVILSAGVFVVVLAGLGLTHSQQVKERTQLEEELTVTEMRLDKLDTSGLEKQYDDLKTQLEEKLAQLNDVKYVLRQPIESIDVTDEFFVVAAQENVEVITISSTSLTKEKFSGVSCTAISLMGTVTGELDDIIDFIINLNNDYTTGYIRSAQITIGENTVTANINMVIYSYQGD
jgi:hypothetical protein